MKQFAILLFCCLASLSVSAQEQDSTPKSENTASLFWQKVYQEHQMPKYFQRKGYRYPLRQEMGGRCADYLQEIDKITYRDAYIQDYVESVFSQVAPTDLDPERPENLNVRVFQAPAPDAFMLPNGTMLISTGMLCTLNSEEELKAVIANEMAHYVLDHQIYNVARTRLRAKRAVAWGTALAITGYVAGAVSVATDDYDYYSDNRASDIAALISLGSTIGAVASIATADATINSQMMDHLGLKFKQKQEVIADQVATAYLTDNNIQPNALPSALRKIKGFYETEHQVENIPRYGSCKTLQKRINALAGNAEEFPMNHFYRKTVSDIVTFNAMMYLNDRLYKQAEALVLKNIDNQLASPHDYVILTKARMAQSNTPESNEECMQLLQKARALSSAANLDIDKQEILLLLRMKKEAQAATALQQYMERLREYAQQNANNDDERRWIEEEAGWAEKCYRHLTEVPPALGANATVIGLF